MLASKTQESSFTLYSSPISQAYDYQKGQQKYQRIKTAIKVVALATLALAIVYTTLPATISLLMSTGSCLGFDIANYLTLLKSALDIIAEVLGDMISLYMKITGYVSSYDTACNKLYDILDGPTDTAHVDSPRTHPVI